LANHQNSSPYLFFQGVSCQGDTSGYLTDVIVSIQCEKSEKVKKRQHLAQDFKIEVCVFLK
jgi:hypothetical protein